MSTPESTLARLDRLVATAIPRDVRTRIFCQLMGVDDELQVLSGEFAGMRYVRDGVGSQLYPKLLGTYELELVPVIRTLNARRLTRIVDVGAAEGFYAVGLARCNPQAVVIAFEATPKGRALVARMALANGVADRVEVRGFCRPRDLADAVRDGRGTLVVMDVEGAEAELIDLHRCPGLANSHLLIELHSSIVEGIGQTLLDRLGATHRVVDIWARDRTLADLPVSMSRLRRTLFARLYLRAMNERRVERMRWLYAEPLS
jgi:hypothetical protein